MKHASPASKLDETAEPWRDAILDSTADGVFTVDPDWRVTYLNPAGERIAGTLRSQAVGRFCFEVFRANICAQADCRLQAPGALQRVCENRRAAPRAGARGRLRISALTGRDKHKADEGVMT